jgi:hypothetical protein
MFEAEGPRIAFSGGLLKVIYRIEPGTPEYFIFWRGDFLAMGLLGNFPRSQGCPWLYRVATSNRCNKRDHKSGIGFLIECDELR